MNENPPSQVTAEPKPTEAVAVRQKSPVVMAERGIVIRDIDQLYRVAHMIVQSGLAPKGLEKPEAVCVAVQMGLEVGLTPMASLQNIAVINGRPSIWGDAQLAVCRATGEMESFREWVEVAGKPLADGRTPTVFGDDVVAVCEVKRRGFQSSCGTFGVADAKRAGLWAKQGPWTQYPGRMLKLRARSYALRDQFGDALRGLDTAENLRDLPAIEVETVRVGEPVKSAEVAVSSQNPLPQAVTVTCEPPGENVCASTAPLSPQEQVQKAVEGGGFTLAQAVAAWDAEGILNTGENPKTWDDFSLVTAKRFLRKPEAFLGLIQRTVEKEASK